MTLQDQPAENNSVFGSAGAAQTSKEFKEEALSSKGTEFSSLREAQRKFYLAQSTRSPVFRQQKLAQLGAAIKKYENEIAKALHEDMGKSAAEAFISEIGFVYKELNFVKWRLSWWMRPKRVWGSLLTFPASSTIISEPKGQVLLIGPWNYPVQLLMLPLIGSIAAGNCTVIKPSEMAPHTAAIVTKIITETFSEEFVAVFNGGPEVSNHLLEVPWGHVFFTGSTRVGRLVAMKAMASLSPVTLELGGKSPCIVHKDADIHLAAKRIIWGKMTNAGQTCVAPDYILAHVDIKEKLVQSLIFWITAFYGKNPKESPDFGRLVSVSHCERHEKFLKDASVIFGGEVDCAARYIGPTLVAVKDYASKMMQEEIFGPILPIMTYDNIDACVEHLQSSEKPLALYFFGEDSNLQNRILSELSFGGGCINDVVLHLANSRVPFGGIGQSGMGAYHGKFSFDTFSHQKNILRQSKLMDLPLRYPPFRPWKDKILKFLLKP